MGKNIKFGVTWQDIIKGFKAKKGKGDGMAATLVLLYLSLGEDFPYNMAKSFTSNLRAEDGWDEEFLEYVKKLKDTNQLSVLMKEMEHKGLLISEKKMKGRRQRFYKINPEIIYMSETTEIEQQVRHFTLGGICRGIREKEDPEATNELLDALARQDRLVYFKKWKNINDYDFIYFLDFLAQEAKVLKLKKARYVIKEHLEDIRRGGLLLRTVLALMNRRTRY